MKVVGRSVRRVEDDRLVRGAGRFVGDVRIPGLVEAVFVRSRYAHARLIAVRPEGALACPGVLAVVTGTELARQGIPEAARRAGAACPPLATGEVRYVGEPVAAVVAESRYLAEDAAEAVDAVYEELEVRSGVGASGAGGEASAQYDLCRTVSYGDVDAAFRTADLVLEETFSIARAAPHPLEPRGILVAPDPVTGGYVVWAGTQMPHSLRRALSLFLHIPERAVRVIVPDVGGAFGAKAGVYPEDFLVAWLARRLGRPVRWMEDRSEHFVATLHEREQHHHIRLAATRGGVLLGVEDTFWMDMGAYALWPHLLDRTMYTIPGPYHLPHYRCTAYGVLTHKTPAGPYRGAGRPQGNFVMERMIDRLAAAVGEDPAEVRLRNLIRPEEMPCRTPLGVTYDSGDYPGMLARALAAAGYRRWREEQARRWSGPRWIGIGLAAYVEDAGSAGPYEGATVRLEPDGYVVLVSGAPASGQAHETAFAQVAAERLGLPLDRIHVAPTDTAVLPLGIGTFGSRSAGIAAGAVWEACGKLAMRLKEIAAPLLEADARDLELAEGEVRVRGAPGRALSVKELARLATTVSLAPLPPGVLPGLEATAYVRCAPQYGGGVHCATVEVDLETGMVRLLTYVVVHDCGTLLNPQVVTGQVQGGVAQGISTVLLEALRYDGAGQLLTRSYGDYLLPTVCDVPALLVEHVEYPSPHTPTGAKGAGEGGTIAALACVANALEDALRPAGGVIRQLPVTPEALWRVWRGG
jgi:carbon-monoxide dehydrogenase large subunit